MSTTLVTLLLLSILAISVRVPLPLSKEPYTCHTIPVAYNTVSVPLSQNHYLCQPLYHCLHHYITPSVTASLHHCLPSLGACTPCTPNYTASPRLCFPLTSGVPVSLLTGGHSVVWPLHQGLHTHILGAPSTLPDCGHSTLPDWGHRTRPWISHHLNLIH